MCLIELDLEYEHFVIDWRVIDWRVIDWRVIDWREQKPTYELYHDLNSFLLQ